MGLATLRTVRNPSLPEMGDHEREIGGEGMTIWARVFISEAAAALAAGLVILLCSRGCVPDVMAQGFTVDVDYQLQRQYKGPLLRHEVFTNAAELAAYVGGGALSRAYAGQVVVLVEGGEPVTYTLGMDGTNMVAHETGAPPEDWSAYPAAADVDMGGHSVTGAADVVTAGGVSLTNTAAVAAAALPSSVWASAPGTTNYMPRTEQVLTNAALQTGINARVPANDARYLASLTNAGAFATAAQGARADLALTNLHFGVTETAAYRGDWGQAASNLAHAALLRSAGASQALTGDLYTGTNLIRAIPQGAFPARLLVTGSGSADANGYYTRKNPPSPWYTLEDSPGYWYSSESVSNNFLLHSVMEGGWIFGSDDPGDWKYYYQSGTAYTSGPVSVYAVTDVGELPIPALSAQTAAAIDPANGRLLGDWTVGGLTPDRVTLGGESRTNWPTGWRNPDNVTNWTYILTYWGAEPTNDHDWFNRVVVQLTSYSGPPDVVIPDFIDGHPVKILGRTFLSSTVFNDPGSILTITAGENLDFIGPWALAGLTNLYRVDTPGVTRIGEGAFYGCSALEEFHIPKTMTYLEGYSFNNMPNLKAIYWGGDMHDSIIFNEATAQVTNYVTNPTATGWGATFSGRPVVRLAVTAERITALEHGEVKADGITLGGVRRATWPGHYWPAQTATYKEYKFPSGDYLVGDGTNLFYVPAGAAVTNKITANP